MKNTVFQQYQLWIVDGIGSATVVADDTDR